MTTDIHLFINEQEVEFTKSPDILYNYNVTDLQNPTIVKNSYSKSITIPGTARNNDIFGHIWDLERYQTAGGFNPLKKASFVLYTNGEVYEEGYCKLDSIKKTGNAIEYSISLYGGLGEFFYNLTYTDSDTDNAKKSLADLKYIGKFGASYNGSRGTYIVEEDPVIDFDINKETVQEAWNVLSSGDAPDTDKWEKWTLINFAPCYNGIPEDFDSNKVLINNIGFGTTSASSGFIRTMSGATAFLNGQTNINGYSLGETSENLTEWESFDLRSYLQRPVINVGRIIAACCEPENNGGYEVKWGPDFGGSFRGTDGWNPYASQLWMTLPMIRDLNIQGGASHTVSSASLSKFNSNHYNFQYSRGSIAKQNGARITIRMKFNPSSPTVATELYTYHYYSSSKSALNSSLVKYFGCNNAVIVQLMALDGVGNVVANSKAYCLSSSEYIPDDNAKMWKYFYDKDNPADANDAAPLDYEYIYGCWHRDTSGNYYFARLDGSRSWCDIDFELNNPGANFETLVLKMETPTGYYVKYMGLGGYQRLYSGNDNSSNLDLYSVWSVQDDPNKRQLPTVRAMDRVSGSFQPVIKSISITTTDYDTMWTNRRITKDKLLKTDKTPADYLLSWAKLFGLYFYKLPGEESDNKEKYPKGVIHICSRDDFYNSANSTPYDPEQYVDLEGLIDRKKDIKITPVTAKSKWYEFSNEEIESECGNNYKATYGSSYGRQLVNTGYDFDSNTNSLYDGNAFKSGVMVREQDKYFVKPLNSVPAYCFNGFKYSLFKRGSGTGEEYETAEIEKPVIKLDTGNINYYGLSKFDSMPKLQCHTEDNAAGDGDGVLLFLRGVQRMPSGFNYWLTDDINEMAVFNEGNPCWILTKQETNAAGTRIAYARNSLPWFTRDWIGNSGQEGKIIHSLDFGNPQAVYVPNAYVTRYQSLYTKFWQNYIRDMYNENTRLLTCYVRILERPNVEWLRRFYWFDNSIWRLNSIKDWKMGQTEPTLCEFIKVQDVQNYQLDPSDYNIKGSKKIVLPQYEFSSNEQTISGKVYIQDPNMECWYISENYGGIYWKDDAGNTQSYEVTELVSPDGECGEESNIYIHMPANNSNYTRTWSLSIYDEDGGYIYVDWKQNPMGQ